ncbi:3'-5' exonuclease [Gluconobacter japonicus]|uniref:DNA polymerase III subunit epsilon n=1 Tax=Gluconobacter japonicus TaxID=376620 RepID=A0ABQ5WEV3_GLUJA|nr:3'-5' exonuclease [Gluconobacter japonicus]KXV29927.1 DNA polymerase III subunit epsilon [Gluconobacter japonicus]GBR28094.1 DNA polymerase III subunit epsilon and related 3'-5' exonuclease [Gluconobacter japonicus NBRC 3271]GLQ58238.1 DNA polymerase III subunit epsilon [Gluconobacter japonicus]
MLVDNSLPSDRALEALANRLEASEDYRVLRRLHPSVLGHKPEGRGLRTGLFVDLETTGLDPRQDEIIEIGMVPFIYRIDGLLLGTLPAFSRLREPSIPVPAFVQDLTGLTPERLAGHTISPDEVAAFASDASLVIAHNAAFDRPFLERFCPAFVNKPWACSMEDIPWDQAGFEGRKLGHLGLQAGFFFDGHRAVDDCQAAIALLGHTGFPENRSALSLLLERARTVWTRLWAEYAPFELKDTLKARGYRWNDGSDGRPKAWFIDRPPEEVEEEVRFLRSDIYQRDVDIPIRPVEAGDRFTNRV